MSDRLPAYPAPPTDIVGLIDHAPISSRQLGVYVLCGLTAMADGFDLQITGSLAPLLSDVLHIQPGAFGLIFATGFLGILVGSLVLGQISDRAGRRWMVIISLLIAGSFTALVPPLAAAGALGFKSLAACRFVAGLGVGGVLPNVLALTTEYAPHRSRAFIVNTMYCGVPLGSVAVGLATAALAARYGWQVIFWIGGGGTLLLAMLCIISLPESVRYLITRGARQDRVHALVRRMIASPDTHEDYRFLIGDGPAVPRARLGALFAEGRGIATILLWTAMFLNLLLIVFVLSWLPLTMRQAGLPMQVGVLLAALFSLGGMAGSVIVGWLIDRFGSVPVLTGSYLAAAAAIAGYGVAAASGAALYAITLLAGAFVIGAQSGVIAMVASFYPTAIRSTGLGWALGVGRIGSIVGPALGGVMLSASWSIQGIFLAASTPAVAAAGTILAIHLLRPGLTKPC